MPSERSSFEGEDFASLFNFLPIGAYRSTWDGGMVRANPALVALNGYETEAELLASVKDIATEWYVDPGRRAEFLARIQRDGQVKAFVSEIWRHRTRERIWISENAHALYDEQGNLRFFEGTVEDINEQVLARQALQRSEEQLKHITSQIPGMVYVVHIAPDGRRTCRYVSEGVRDIFGVEPSDAINDPELLVRYHHPDDAHMHAEDTRRILERPEALGGEFRVVVPGGEVKWVLRRSGVVSHDETGQLRVGVFLDVTGRKQAEAALSESEALWRLAMESAGDGVWDWNIATGEEVLSDRIKAMFGYDDSDELNMAADLDARTHPDDRLQMQIDRQAHFEGRTAVYRNEHRVRCKDGNWKWVLSRGVVIARDEDGHPLRMVGTHTDITDIKQAEVLQRSLEIQLREAQKLEAIGTLAGGVAHDFNNLLAVILGNLTLAREDVGPDHPAQESLNEMSRASVRAKHLVQQILTFSRRQAQELKHQMLQPLVVETLHSMRTLLPAGVQQVEEFADQALPVLADATQLQQVLMNLCTNAWQAMEASGGVITVGLHRQIVDEALSQRLNGLAQGDYARLSVGDNGPGMEAATVQRIFEPFFTTKQPGAGTGLGLAVVHGIVKAHKGAIEVISEQGQGTRFDIYLPIDASQEAAAVSPKSAEVLVSGQQRAFNGRHVVYIDDYEAMVFLVGRLLRKHGYRVSTFTSGKAALDWMRSEADTVVDLVVTDQNMPGLTGIEVAAEVQRLRPGVRTVLITGHVTDALLAQAAELGVLEVMGKQDSMAELGESIRTLLDSLDLSGPRPDSPA
jgi:PAS domain S-box-containing protein